MAFSASIFSGFARMQGDPHDTILVNYILEHVHRVFFFRGYVGRLWSPPCFFPVRGTLAYSENLLGAIPIYSALRILASPATAFQLWMIAISALTFGSMVFLLRALGIRPNLSAFGAFLFAYGMPRVSQIFHPQLFPQLFSPLALLTAWRFLRDPGRKGLVITLGLVYLQTVAGVYLGWLLMFGLFLFVISSFAVERETVSRVLAFLRRDRLFAGACAIGFGSLLLWTFHPYLRVQQIVGTRPWEEVTLTLPSLRSWFTAPPGSLHAFWLGPSESTPLPWEHELFLGLVFWLLALAPWIRPSRATENSRETHPLAATAWLTFGLMILLSLKVGVVSLWWLVYHVIPGAQALRAVSRIWTVAYLVLIPGVLLSADRWIDQKFVRKRALVSAAILCLGIFEQCIFHPPSFSKEQFFGPVRTTAGLLRRSAEAGYVELSPALHDFTEAQLLGMWAGLEANVPVINGYNGNSPPGYPPLSTTMTDPQIEDWLETLHGRVLVVSPDAGKARELIW